MDDAKHVIPTFNIRRQKTDKYYTTYCTPEAVNAINSYLLSRTDHLTDDKQLFKIGNCYFSDLFANMNGKLGLGKVGVIIVLEVICFVNFMLQHFIMKV